MNVPPPGILMLGWVIWLPFFSQPVVDLLRARAPLSLTAVCLVLLGVFVALYTASAWRNARELGRLPARDFRDRIRPRLPNMAGLVIVSVAMALLWHAAGATNVSSFVFTSAYFGGSLRPRRAIIANGALYAVYVAIGRLAGQTIADAAFLLFLITVVTFVTISWVSAVIAGNELRAAHGEIARLATEAERSRITRDLHDLLGHQLSLITLKSELAGRLVESDPKRSAEEIKEVEQLVRSTLHEVRAAVSRYRKPTVAVELRAGAEILSAAGVRLEGDWDGRAIAPLPAGHEEALAWVVRESVTNVVRHSNAEVCRLCITKSEDALCVELRNDRSARRASAPHDDAASAVRGTGIEGIRERVAGIGGSCAVGPTPDGGFSVLVRIPRSVSAGEGA